MKQIQCHNGQVVVGIIYVTSILKNENMLADPEKLKHWLPVDLYIGGVEHAVSSLIVCKILA